MTAVEDYFSIKHTKIEEAWNPPDGSLELGLLDYCDEVLNIPLSLISNTSYSYEGIEIELNDLEDWMMGEDWYINLFRLSDYKKAS